MWKTRPQRDVIIQEEEISMDISDCEDEWWWQTVIKKHTKNMLAIIEHIQLW